MLGIKNNQKGSSLIEALAVISVISVLSISALKIISSVYGLFKINMATNEIKELQKNISGVYNYSGNYKQFFENDVYKTLCETDKVAPSQMCVKNDSSYILRHRLSGGVTIDKSDDSEGYLITFEGLNKKNCATLAQIEWLDRKKISIYQLNINETPVAYFPKRNNKVFPIDVKSAFSYCNKGGEKNTITWFFY